MDVVPHTNVLVQLHTCDLACLRFSFHRLDVIFQKKLICNY